VTVSSVEGEDYGVDLGAVGAWMDEQGLPPGPITGVVALGGGTQNVLLQLERGGATYVLRRGPRHLRKHSNDAIRREMEVLQALAGTPVPHPRLVAGCADTAVLGDAVFYLMEPVDGFNPTVSLPALHAGDEAIRHEMGLQAAEALAQLGAVDHVAVGLGDVGNPDGFLERQVPRWLDELGRYADLDGYPGHELPAVDEVAAWLDGHRPPSWTPGILHGDYHLANLMFRHDGPEVAAIVDWEMCTIGDPLLDLGWLLATGGSAGLGMGLSGAGGLPSDDEVVARYAEHSSRDLSHVRWYRTMACFKLGIVLEGSNARAAAGLAPRAVGDYLHASAVALLSQAAQLVREEGA
jgi:aminoglycoside phosphotransferase (APT) family kinase protein